jgi:hypothetical protein
MNYGKTTIDWWNALFLAIIFGGAFGLRWWQRREAAKVIVEAPFILGMFVNGMQLEKLAEGNLGDYHYDLMITEPLTIPTEPGPKQYSNADNPAGEALAQIASYAVNSANAGKTILTLHLPIKSPVHIAALGVSDSKTHENIDRFAKQCNLAPAGLEGDFPDFFSLYCRPTEQVAVREILDPSNMAFLVDYCKREDWEIFDNTLYFAQNNAFRKDNEQKIENTTMVKDAEQFVDEILPILLRMNRGETTTSGGAKL